MKHCVKNPFLPAPPPPPHHSHHHHHSLNNVRLTASSKVKKNKKNYPNINAQEKDFEPISKILYNSNCRTVLSACKLNVFLVINRETGKKIQFKN